MKTYKIRMPEDQDKKYTMFRYPAGEMQVRIKEEEIYALGKADVIEVTANISDGEIMELALLSSAISGTAGSKSRKRLVLPYLPYSRADRCFLIGDCAGLKTFGLLISALGYDCIDTYDVHNLEAASGNIVNLLNIPPDDYIRLAIKVLGKKGLTILLPDRGAVRYEKFIRSLGVERYAYGEKVRDTVTGALTGFKVPNGLGQKVLIIDDICDGGGTFIGLAKAIKEKNASAKCYLYVTHGIFSKGFAELDKYFEKVYTTDTFKPARFASAKRI